MLLHQRKKPSIVPFLLRHPDYGGQAGTVVFLNTTPALRTGLLSLSPFLLRPVARRAKAVSEATADKPGRLLSAHILPLMSTGMRGRRT